MATLLPLLRLPWLAMKAVFDTMDLLEIFKISHTSRRAHRFIKMFLSRRNFILTAKFACPFILEARCREHRNYGICMKLLSEYNFGIITKEISIYAALFKICKVLLVVEKPTLAPRAVKLFQSLNLNIDSIVVNLHKRANEYYQEMIELSRVAKNLEILSDPTKKFRLPVSAKPFQFDTLKLVRAEWVTRYYLTNLFINCKELYMENCQLSYSDYLMFFKQWIKESRVEVAKIHMKEERNFSPMFKQLKATPLNKIKHYGKRLDIPNGRCYMIQQETTGIRAAVLYTESNNLVNLTTDFEL
ncbi:hypothetical protein GCK72_011336 [Caenorhabditis remanei]|uniref:F-box domain-containing protein n=1 Tax=Caenorhabditis remanei TaxID=31234 RepID=A0A6A5H883_CAERE|nr:hypothetical protein GCK72_011336 [Caenorhabditis remanei]KAF1763071.1 hypothetical protein GCK72_011336 [Caenorhabditis remanei]